MIFNTASYTEYWFSSYKTKPRLTAKGRQWCGVWYDSNKEARYAEELDYRVEQGLIADWRPKPNLRLYINAEYYGDYRIDFWEYHTNGDIFYTEVKGGGFTQTPDWKKNWLITRLLWPNIEGVEEHAKLLIVK